MNAQNTLNLRPLTLIELFDQAVRLYRGNFSKFVGIIAIGLIPVQIINLVLTNIVSSGMSATSESGFSVLSVYNLGITYFIVLLNAIFVGGVATAALTNAIASSYLGEEFSIGSAYSKISNSWGRLVGALLLLVLLGILALIWTIIPCIGWFTGIGIVGFLSLVISPLVAPVIIIEKRSGMNAIRRAWDMARRRFWWIIGYFILIASLIC